MAVKGSGALSILNDIVVEFGGDAPHSLSEYYGGGTYVPGGANPGIATSGAINFGSHYNAVAATVLNITSNVNNYDIGAAVIAAGGDKSTPVILTIASGVTVGSTSASTAAMFTGTGWSSGTTISITNNGSIYGAGGSSSGQAGGDAIKTDTLMEITNNGSIWAGGGAGATGGSGGAGSYSGWTSQQGWSAGSCNAFSCSYLCGLINRTYISGCNCLCGIWASISTGGGSGGTFGLGQGYSQSNSSGGSGSAGGTNAGTGGSGGSGGTWGSSGSSGSSGSNGNVSNGIAGESGGSAGNYIVNNNEVTWVSTGSRIGGVN